MDEIILILLILTGAWYWWDTQQCNELALVECQKKCANAGLQLLDATVTRQRSWLRRGSGGRLQICRLYSFEYSNDVPSEFERSDFGGREHGYIVLIGKQVVETNIPQQDTSTFNIH